MRLLFEIDLKNYKEGGTVGRRPSVRGIILRDGKIAMVHSLKYDYYKFPGGGMEPGESQEAALIREVKEETGFAVAAESIRPFGTVRRVQKGLTEDIFVQENYYYFCDVSAETGAQSLDSYEAEEGFVPEWVSLSEAIRTNRSNLHDGKQNDLYFRAMLERDNRVLLLLLQETVPADGTVRFSAAELGIPEWVLWNETEMIPDAR